MKKIIFCIFLLVVSVGMVFSQNNDDWKWGGTVRFKPVATITGLLLGGFEVDVDWVNYITPSVGIPMEISIASIGGIMGFGIMSGIEIVPVRHKEKSGLYLTALGGLLFFTITDDSMITSATANSLSIIQYPIVAVKTDIGYQLVTDSGFVFTPAIGVKYIGVNYDGIGGVLLDLMLDIGFAYRR